MNRILNSIIEGYRIAFRSISTNKIRSILTTLCITIGIVSVTSMNTITDGINRSFEDSLSSLGRNVVYIEKWPWGLGGGEYKWWEYRNRPPLELEYVEQLQVRSEYTSTIGATISTQRTIRYDDTFLEFIEIRGTTPNYSQIISFDLEQGRFFTDDENTRRSSVVILGSEVEKTLFDGVPSLGKEIRLGGKKFTVIGTFKQQGDFLGISNTDNIVVIPIHTYESLYSLRSGVTIIAQYPDEPSLEEGTYELEGIMRQVRGLDPLADNDFAINKPNLFESEFKSMTFVIYAIGLFLTGLALFIGGIGVMNIMFVSVKERTKEIGIRKAVGAQPWEILTQFLIEAVILCLIGGSIGILLSVGVTQLINTFFIAYMSWGTVLWAILLCSLVGILFGFIPSYKASTQDPIESLRYE